MTDEVKPDALDPEQQIVMLMGRPPAGPLLFLGFPQGAWDYMAEGRVHVMDLTQAGVGLKIIITRGETKADVERILQETIGQAPPPSRSAGGAAKPAFDAVAYRKGLG